MPVGQSRAQPLQDRQRSSAACTSGERQPWVISDPLTISCSARARPRVESFSSRVAWKLGHITPPDTVEFARHLPTPEHWCTASTNSASVLDSGDRLAATMRRFASTGSGSTSTPGFSRPLGSKMALTAPKSRRASAEYMWGSSAERARPSPCSPDIEPPNRATRRAASSTNAL